MKCDQQDIFRIDYGGLFEDRKVEDLQQKDFLLMPPSVYAFVLRSRQWVTVPMAGLSSVSFENNFEELMLPADHKKTVLALVETHERGHGASSEAAERSTANSLDIVKGKGAGLIILLHGEPAFKSRVHLSLYYPRLGLDAVLKLCEVFLHKTKEAMQRPGALQFRIKEDEIFSFAKRHHESLHKQGTWNGRQIRNAFQTAIALVEYDIIKQTSTSKKPSLGKKQFKVVAEASRKFGDYLIRTLQGFDDEIAAKDQWRNDQDHNVSIGAGRPSESESGSSESGAEEEKAVPPMGIAKGKSKEQDSGQFDKELFEEFRRFKMMQEKYGGV
ncbi:hypothetical protein CMQ_4382 [Grosmannia clavigera kw1407]|uniref:AAA+ ATPase lid domain-containing protein n=1 Tax=Grosmannia clavigera (strain kw1407 / UAMH 11150) TaxID=655863 RepID=F0XTY2_GROCL|nr:uncharacterized protein CMQ_4382 [Grosmannia clavigera kw1407]EFW98530.1 hypothetical protein CMQ_4382 [Grosmannia clavigera kw1407]